MVRLARILKSVWRKIWENCRTCYKRPRPNYSGGEHVNESKKSIIEIQNYMFK